MRAATTAKGLSGEDRDTASYGAIKSSAIATEGGRIAWVGAMADLPGAPETLARQVIDASGRWITPGLVDCHTHLVYGGDRAREFEMRLEGASYAEIAAAGGGIVSTVAATRETDEAVLFRNAAKRLKSLMAEGVTTVEIKSGYGLDSANERKMLRVARRLGREYPVTVRTTFLGAHALPPEFKDRADAYIDDVCGTQLPAAVKEGLVDAVDAFCEKIAFTPEQTARVFAAARAHNLPVKLHADQLSDLGGAALASRFDALSADHLEYTGVDGVKAMAAAGAVAVLLPGAFYILKETKLPLIDDFRENGVPIALATDGNPGSSPIFSLLTILNMGCTLFGMTPAEALAGVTRNGAQALGMAADIGTLEVGKRADFAIFDIDHPAELAYRIGQNPCVGRVVNGEPTA